MREVDIKLLWGRAASRCSMCRIPLSETRSASGPSFHIGEQAHIVGREEGSARGQSTLTQEERDRYHNLLLLCPNDHSRIEADPVRFPVERLHQLKTDHELWVQNNLGPHTLVDEANQLAYAMLIDDVTEACRLGIWRDWTSGALEEPPLWPPELPDHVFQLNRRVLGAVLPGTNPGLERAIQTLARTLAEAARVFGQHAGRDEDGYWRGTKFYMIDQWDPPEYEHRFQAFCRWVDECGRLLVTATKAANWFADEVRASINPLFFLREGRFLVTLNTLEGSRTTLHEFTAEEKQALPTALLETDQR